MGCFERGLIFDLDDTLYLERDFALSGFAAAGAWWRRKTGRTELAAHCVRFFEEGVRGQIFDRALAEMGCKADPSVIEQLVLVYREHEPSISLAPDVAQFLSTLSKSDFIGIVTDGPVVTQRSKIKALGLDQKAHLILCTDEFGVAYRKPHPRAFEMIEASSHLAPSQLTYIGDNAVKDFITPRERGWKTVQILRDDRVHRRDGPTPMHEAESRIVSFKDILSLP